MIVVWVLLFIVAGIFSYLFFAPFYLEVNSINGLCRMRFHRIASLSIRIAHNSLYAEVRIAAWKKQIDLLATKKGAEKMPVEKMKSVKKARKKIPWKKIKGVLSSFKINKCSITIDFGDMQLNGILYPVFYGIGMYSGKDISINFVEENKIILEIENSLARMSWAYFNS